MFLVTSFGCWREVRRIKVYNHTYIFLGQCQRRLGGETGKGIFWHLSWSHLSNIVVHLHCNSGDEARRLTFPYIITTSGSNILVMSSLLFVHGARFFFARQQRRVLCLSGYCDKVEQRQNSRKKWLMSTLKWHKSLLLLKLEVHRVIMSVLISLLTSMPMPFLNSWCYKNFR